MELQDAIAHASGLAFDEDADMVVGQIGRGNWQIAHTEDVGRQANMIEPKFTVHSSGVDESHIKNGEITDDWELPDGNEDEYSEIILPETE